VGEVDEAALVLQELARGLLASLARGGGEKIVAVAPPELGDAVVLLGAAAGRPERRIDVVRAGVDWT
jgi:hypothetical protein